VNGLFPDPESYRPFEAAALEALRQWEYAPATLQDKPVPVMIKIAINFSAK
jgi:outer membrane biosynthesis protein TonB